MLGVRHDDQAHELLDAVREERVAFLDDLGNVGLQHVVDLVPKFRHFTAAELRKERGALALLRSLAIGARLIALGAQAVALGLGGRLLGTGAFDLGTDAPLGACALAHA